MKHFAFILSILLSISLFAACDDNSSSTNGTNGEVQCDCMGAFCENNTHYQWTGCEYTGDNARITECSVNQKCVPYDGCIAKCTNDEDCAAENKVCATDQGVCVTPDSNNKPAQSAIDAINSNISSQSKSCLK